MTVKWRDEPERERERREREQRERGREGDRSCERDSERVFRFDLWFSRIDLSFSRLTCFPKRCRTSNLYLDKPDKRKKGASRGWC